MFNLGLSTSLNEMFGAFCSKHLSPYVLLSFKKHLLDTVVFKFQKRN